jgi:hypothetical protein
MCEGVKGNASVTEPAISGEGVLYFYIRGEKNKYILHQMLFMRGRKQKEIDDYDENEKDIYVIHKFFTRRMSTIGQSGRDITTTRRNKTITISYSMRRVMELKAAAEAPIRLMNDNSHCRTVKTHTC